MCIIHIYIYKIMWTELEIPAISWTTYTMKGPHRHGWSEMQQNCFHTRLFQYFIMPFPQHGCMSCSLISFRSSITFLYLLSVPNLRLQTYQYQNLIFFPYFIHLWGSSNSNIIYSVLIYILIVLAGSSLRAGSFINFVHCCILNAWEIVGAQ